LKIKTQKKIKQKKVKAQKFKFCNTELLNYAYKHLKIKKKKNTTYIINNKKFTNTLNLKDSLMAISLNCMNRAKDKNGFQAKIKYFMQKASLAVLGEELPIGDEHVARVAYANDILDGTASIYEYAVGVVTNATIATTINGGSEPTDSELEFAVNSMFSDFAGWDQ